MLLCANEQVIISIENTILHKENLLLCTDNNIRHTQNIHIRITYMKNTVVHFEIIALLIENMVLRLKMSSFMWKI